MARRMFRYWLTVDGGPQRFKLGGDPVHVEAGRLGAGPDAPHIVEFWVPMDDDDFRADADTRVWRTFQVFGTGHELPEGARWFGTTGRTSEGFVWHLFEVPR